MKHAVIAAVDLDAKAAGVVRHAANLARLCRAGLVVTHAMDDSGLGQTGYAPFVQPAAVRDGALREAHGWLVGLSHHLGFPDAEIAVTVGRPRAAVATLALERHARYIVIGQSKWGTLSALAGLGEDAGCEIVSVGLGSSDVRREASGGTSGPAVPGGLKPAAATE